MGKPLTTVMSTKGQVILPKELRDRLGLHAGVKFEIEDTPDGVLLRPAALFPPTRLKDVVGMLKRPGQRARSIEEMDEAVRQRAGRLDRDRY